MGSQRRRAGGEGVSPNSRNAYKQACQVVLALGSGCVALS